MPNRANYPPRFTLIPTDNKGVLGFVLQYKGAESMTAEETARVNQVLPATAEEP